jgi:hypothetical protein
MHPVNPYSAGGIVKDPDMFFGRDEELRHIRNRMRSGNSTAVVGLRRIGKSSLLYQLVHQADSLPDGVVAVYLDLHEPAHHRPLDLLTSALCHLDERLDHRYDFSQVKSLSGFSTAIKQVAAGDLQPILCLDEMEELTERDVFDDDFFECLRSLGSQGFLSFVTASSESLDALIKRKKITSPFYNIFINLDLAGLSDRAARALLTEPFHQVGLAPPTDDHVDYVLELVGHHPFYLQIAAYHLFEAQRKGGVLDHQMLRKVVSHDTSRHFQALWRHLSAERQTGLKRLADVRDWERTQDDLEGCGLIEAPSTGPRVFSDIFAQQVREGTLKSEKSKSLPEVVKASVRKRWQRQLLGGLTIVSILALALWLVFGNSSQAATLNCNGGDYVVCLDYPRYLAIGDRGRVDWNLHNNTTQPVTATLATVLFPTRARIEGPNSYTIKGLKRANSGQVSFYRRPPWRQGISLTPEVELEVDGVPVTCEGTVDPIRAGAIPWLNSVWVWFSTTGPFSWLVLAGLEFIKTLGKKQADD